MSDLRKILNQRMLLIRHDEESGGIMASDQGGYILTHKEFLEITEGLNKFFECYDDKEIERYNQESDERRARQQLEQAVKGKGNRKAIAGSVYLIRAENGLYKIGKAKSLKNRLQPFTVHFPMKWELVTSFHANDYSAAEALLHEKYASKRDVGEWFRLSDEDVEYIKRIQDGQL